MSAPLYYLEGNFIPYRALFLEQSYRTLHYKAGNIIYEPHTEWDSMMYLNSGKVKISIVQNEREKLLAFYGEGYLIPYYVPAEICISHLIQFTAVTDVTVLQVSRQDFEELLAKNTKLRNEVYLSAWRLIHLLTHEVESQTLDSGLERVATFLYTYFENTGHELFEISTRDLQSFVGLNRTNLSKYLSFLVNAHVIAKERGFIRIIAPEKLKNFCSDRVIRCDIVPSNMAHGAISEEDKWEAICNRDATYDGVFWYGVKSTGIFCVPSCKSRLARRENIEYFDSPQEALQAGYRICKRCRPDILSYNPNRRLAEQIRDYLDEHFCEKEVLEQCSIHLSVEPKHLIKVFKIQYDATPHAYIQEKRLEKAVQLLEHTDMNILDIALSSGFSSMSNFYSTFKGSYGMSPTQYRKSESDKQ
ncbi:Ada metal-binding domain-containing protein [Caproiciproducens sp. CPB-2]|uniref:Ada metal-binding domain-containing protein n=1 Tax=Caproiciproducens sp. CPB-2 TaxID=3030017 RepID=UPI0023DB0396|nr:Ada metal-binding domain-containing protein [Caproiciproducens sp. CPB-2]MDF1493175.1 Ada metal-binding domain-containing protein [Caproiciproducens sp. CPB-2]